MLRCGAFRHECWYERSRAQALGVRTTTESAHTTTLRSRPGTRLQGQAVRLYGMCSADLIMDIVSQDYGASLVVRQAVGSEYR